MSPEWVEHGTRSRYTRRGCRCDLCVAGNTAYHWERRAVRKALLQANRTLALHGWDSTYKNWGCRCDLCWAAHAAVMRRQRRARKATPEGSQKEEP